MPKASKAKPATKETRSRKVISKKDAAPPKAVAKKTAAKEKPKAVDRAGPKKKAVKPVVAADEKSLDMCLLLDCTSSMASWIERSKETLKNIIANVKEDYKGLKVRVAFVGYRDVGDKPRFEVLPFTQDLDAATSFISKMRAQGGADMPEDVQGGLE